MSGGARLYTVRIAFHLRTGLAPYACRIRRRSYLHEFLTIGTSMLTKVCGGLNDGAEKACAELFCSWLAWNRGLNLRHDGAETRVEKESREDTAQARGSRRKQARIEPVRQWPHVRLLRIRLDRGDDTVHNSPPWLAVPSSSFSPCYPQRRRHTPTHTPLLPGRLTSA